MSLLVEVEYAEPVGDEVQAPEAEGLEWLEDRWNPHPGGRDCGELQRAKTNHIVGARHGGSGRKMDHPMTKSVERTASSPWTAPTVGAESDQLVNIYSFVVRYDRRWPSAQ